MTGSTCICFVVELEDMSNIMRVISLKNYCENTRVVIQLLQYQNKVKHTRWRSYFTIMSVPGEPRTWRKDNYLLPLFPVSSPLTMTKDLSGRVINYQSFSSIYLTDHPLYAKMSHNFLGTFDISRVICSMNSFCKNSGRLMHIKNKRSTYFRC